MHSIKGVQHVFYQSCLRVRQTDLVERARLAVQPTVLQQAAYSQTAQAPVIDKLLLSKLRKQTGFAFSNCRKALVLHNNDFDQALEWLNEESAKAGWAKATKLSNRPMSQGVIGLVRDGNKALLLEVNCETDFVAKNVKFLELVSNVTNLCFHHMQSTKDWRVELADNSLTTLADSASQSIADIVAKEVGSIGENIKASRAVCLTIENSDQHLAHYLHNAGLNEKYLEIERCHFGKYGCLSALQGAASAEIQLHGTQLCQHIVGMNPQSIDAPVEAEESVDQPTSSEESTETPEKTKETEKIESRLLHQEFLLDPDFKVKQWLTQRQLVVKDFVRYAVGENATW